MAKNAEKIIATRDFTAYRADWASTVVMPANTVLPGEVSSPFVDQGYTIGGLGIAFAITRGSINVDQAVDPILTPVTGRTITISTNLAEITMENLNAAAGLGTTETTAPVDSTPGPAARGYTDLIIADDVPDEFGSYLFETLQQNGEAFRALLYKGQTTGSPNIQIRPTEAAQIALSIGARVDTSTGTPRVMLIRSIVPALP